MLIQPLVYTYISTYLSRGTIQYWNMLIRVESRLYGFATPRIKVFKSKCVREQTKATRLRGKYHPYTSFRHAGRSFLVLQHIQLIYMGPL